jgi:putative ABC transport system ATP-binding protein
MLLDIRNLSFSRGRADQRFQVEISRLSMRPGEMIAITGESGCGKSTALEMLGLLVRPESWGSYRLGDGQGFEEIGDLWKRNDRNGLARLRAATIGFVLQTGGLLPYLDVAGNLSVNRRLLGQPAWDDHVEMIINGLEIENLLNKKPSELSVGQHQRASVARALAHKPSLVLADEPTSALDPRLGNRVMELMLNLAAGLSIAVILATHARAEVVQLGLREIQAEPLRDGYGSRFGEQDPRPFSEEKTMNQRLPEERFAKSA